MGSGFRTFQSGEVLTSSNVQNYLMDQAITVFAGTAARGSAIASPETGMVSYRTDGTADSKREGFEFYDGAAWTRLVPAASLGGLVYLTGAAFATATSFSLPNSTFTSTYRNYRIHIDLTAVTADADFTMRLRASGTDNSTTNYRSLLQGLNTTGATGTVVNINSAGATSWNAGEQDAATIRYAFAFDVMSPQLATSTRCLGQYMFRDKADGDDYIRQGALHFTATTQFDSLSFISSVASSITGTYRVYGYADS